ncbi:acyl-[acyl-carrier-protein] thioesterase [Geofilum sp. OHC36d9]|uniref:acyl-[acyl-carrier-protein] thioesterase n=1 Tax=Geofilum sp. OHC36d9 TaxID=3458413 RepID=UPI0040348321
MSSYKHQLKVASFDLTTAGTISIPAILRGMQQAAHEHASVLGVGYHQLKQQNIFWVLHAITLEIKKLPTMDETCIIETWPRCLDKLLTSRDFTISNGTEDYVKATSQWLMVNSETKRLVRPAPHLTNMPFEPDHKAIPESIEQPETFNYSSPCEIRKVRYSDLDINRHVNNTRYVEWLLDTLHDQMPTSIPIKKITLHYLSEFTEGEDAAIHCRTNNESDIKMALIHTNGKAGLLAHLHFRP